MKTQLSSNTGTYITHQNDTGQPVKSAASTSTHGLQTPLTPLLPRDVDTYLKEIENPALRRFKTSVKNVQLSLFDYCTSFGEIADTLHIDFDIFQDSSELLLYTPNYIASELENFLNYLLTGTISMDKVNTINIKDVEILAEDKVVRVTFSDNTTEKAVCNELDEFSLERAVEVCICKHLLGGTSKFNKAVRQGLKVYDNKLKAEEIEKAEKERIEKKREKHNTYRARCRAKAEQAEKEKQIEIQKEAYLQAMREYKKEKE